MKGHSRHMPPSGGSRGWHPADRQGVPPPPYLSRQPEAVHRLDLFRDHPHPGSSWEIIAQIASDENSRQKQWLSHPFFTTVPSTTDHRTMRGMVEDPMLGARYGVLIF